MLFEGGTRSILIGGWAGVGGEGSRSWFGGGLDVIMESQLCTNVQQHVVLEDTNQGEATLPSAVRADLLREPLKRWKVETNHLIAL